MTLKIHLVDRMMMNGKVMCKSNCLEIAVVLMEIDVV